MMNDSQLKTTLQAVSKHCFINCYEKAAQQNGEMSIEDIIECNPGLTYSLVTMKTKRSGIKRIFKAGRQVEALDICHRSRAKVSLSFLIKAHQILLSSGGEYCTKDTNRPFAGVAAMLEDSPCWRTARMLPW